MEQSTLKKEFNPRDVQRMRNIITGNTGDKTQIQVGWDKNKQKHEEGDIWEESGKEWTIKNGIKMSMTKLDKVKELTLMPLICPECKNIMKVNDYNKKMWTIHQKCFECVVKMESEIKRLGGWEEYSINIMNRNKNAELDDLELALEQWVNESETFVSEQGEIEKWGGGDRRAVYKQVKEEIAKLKEQAIYNGKNL